MSVRVGDRTQPCSSTASCRGSRSTSACSRRPRTRRTRCSSASSSPPSPRRISTSSSWCASPALQHAVEDGDDVARPRRPDARRSSSRPSRERAHAMRGVALPAGRRTSSCPRWPTHGHPHRRRLADLERPRSARARRVLHATTVLPVLTPLAIDVVAAVSAALVAQPEPRVLAASGDGRDRASARHRAGAGRSAAARPARRRRRRHVRAARGRDPRRDLPQLFPGQPILRIGGLPPRARRRAGARRRRRPHASGAVERELRQRRRERRRPARGRGGASATSCGAASARPARGQAERDVYACRAARPPRADGADGSAGLRRAARSRRSSRSTSLADEQADIFALLDERDILLHHPYESFDPVIALVDAGGRRSRRARDQADAVPHERRLADRRAPARAPPSTASRSRCSSS